MPGQSSTAPESSYKEVTGRDQQACLQQAMVLSSLLALCLPASLSILQQLLEIWRALHAARWFKPKIATHGLYDNVSDRQSTFVGCMPQHCQCQWQSKDRCIDQVRLEVQAHAGEHKCSQQ